MVLININHLTVIYPDGHKAIDDITFHIDKGQKVAVIGANGAGKSTLLLSLVGIIMPSPQTIIINNIVLNKNSLNDIRAKIGVVFQNPDDQLFMTKVYDDIAFGPRNYGVPEPEIAGRIDSILKALGIPHLKERMPHRLSGGEKRSVALASVLSMHPDILLLDEPSSSLDPRARKKLLVILADLPQTQLIATHDLDMALDICDRVIILKDGSIRADGKPQEILTNKELLQKNGLELPFRYGGR